MFTLPSLRLPFLGADSTPHRTVAVPPVRIHDVETAADRRPRTLKHLLKANHANHALIYHGLRFHNHTPHILGSAYILGATSEQLNAIYDHEAEELEPWRDAPGEVSREDWRDYLGRREYQRAFVDFFEDQLVVKKYDWKRLLEEYMYGGKEPLINGLVSGLAHPLIHLGYAYELDSRTVAIEALAMGSCFYGELHKYVDDEAYTRPGSGAAPSTKLADILERVRRDKRFDGLYEERSGDIGKVFAEREDAFLEHWNAWELSEPTAQFRDSQELAVAVLVGTEKPEVARFDFFFVHLVTSSHAVRILLPLVPAKFHVKLVRQWWLFALAVYIAQTRPAVSPGKIHDFELRGKNWRDVTDKAVNSAHATDAHFVKALRAMQVAAETWGDGDEYYLKAAVKFGGEFAGWGGFGEREEGVEYNYPERQ